MRKKYTGICTQTHMDTSTGGHLLQDYSPVLKILMCNRWADLVKRFLLAANLWPKGEKFYCTFWEGAGNVWMLSGSCFLFGAGSYCSYILKENGVLPTEQQTEVHVSILKIYDYVLSKVLLQNKTLKNKLVTFVVILDKTTYYGK